VAQQIQFDRFLIIMDLSVIVTLVVMIVASIGVIGLRRFAATTDAGRHQLGLIAAIFFVLFCTTLLDEHHNYVNKWELSLVDLLRQTTMLCLISLGAAVVIIAGGIDLSVGSVIAFSASICATFMVLLAPDAVNQSLSVGTGVIVMSIVGTLIVGLLIGSLHAWLITEVGLPPFVATLGTLVGLRSLSRAIVENVTQAMLGGARTQINIADKSFRELSGAISGTVLNLTILAAIVAVILWLLLSKTVTGRHLYALGGNEQAARLSGIQTNRMKWLAYCISSFLSSLAGVLYVSQLSVADPQTLARGYELNAIAASVVGGCSLQGGLGTIPGTLLGALFLRVVIDGVAKIIKTGADVYEGLIVGVLVVFAVTFTKTSESMSSNRRRLFSGPLGWVTIVNLTLLAGVMMALLGAKLLRGRVQMDAAWLALIAAVSTLFLLLILRSEVTGQRRRSWGIAWTVATIVSAIGLDMNYPQFQRGEAVAIARNTGGALTKNDDGGIVVDLARSLCTDVDLKRLLQRVKYFSNVTEIRLNDTVITDSGLDSIGKAFQDSKSLKRLDTTGSKVSAVGLTKLKRTLSGVEIVP
jgi:ribose/xylose/arabinose/galactoside ABC-type transport system permease subunit